MAIPRATMADARAAIDCFLMLLLKIEIEVIPEKPLGFLSTHSIV